MAKSKLQFICDSCEFITGKWCGCCPGCSEWNTMAEQAITPTNSVPAHRSLVVALHNLADVPSTDKKRLVTNIDEWDRVLGGGIMPGSFLILTGDPGIGKSTLLLQAAQALGTNNRVFYFSSEESLSQIKQRVQRITEGCDNVLFSDSGNLDTIIVTAEKEKPSLIIVDSIQNCFFTESSLTPGGVGQLREAAFRLMRLAKEHSIAVIATGHITKDGNIAGPKTLEHMVDGVFYLQGEDRWQTRILRSVKNRFGPVNEIGFFDMGPNGMKEVPNINEILLKEASSAPGAALISLMEGSRPFLLEVQALTIPTKFGIPQRVITGADHKQVILIAAILEKYFQIKLSAHDIFFKVSGGFKIKSPTSDLGIALALMSSYFQQPLPERSIALGEVNLTGQIKPVNLVNTHIDEAQKFGAQQIFLAKNQKASSKIRTLHFANVYDLLRLFEHESQ